jgi:antitoxin component YwqK of YwqJK toxin-antitoxin module
LCFKSQLLFPHNIISHRNQKHFPIFSAVKNAPLILLLVTLIACNNSNTRQRKEFYSTGQLKETVNIDANNLKQDTLILYYKDGIINHKEVYHNDTLNGPFLTYYKDGTLWVKTNYKNGVKHGLTQTYYKNQKLKTCGNYINGLAQDTFVSYYQNQKIQTKEVFRASQTIYKITYDTLGNLSTEYKP